MDKLTEREDGTKTRGGQNGQGKARARVQRVNVVPSFPVLQNVQDRHDL